MKKLTLFIACAVIATTASAQLKVASNGQIRVGQDKGLGTDILTPASTGAGSVVAPTQLYNDTTSTIHVGGQGRYDTGGFITFGHWGDVSIGESEYNGMLNNTKGIMILKGDIIESGGTMKVKSGTLVLDKGFEVKKGGTLTMSLNK